MEGRKSRAVEQLMEEMKNDPWHVKLKRWWNLKVWVLKCSTRKYWDKTYQHYIFKSKEQKEEDAKKLYRAIESSIIRWNNNGKRTAGSLTREILRIIETDK